MQVVSKKNVLVCNTSLWKLSSKHSLYECALNLSCVCMAGARNEVWIFSLKGVKRAEKSNIVDVYVTGTVGQVRLYDFTVG